MFGRKNIFNELNPSENEMFLNLNSKDLDYVISLINMYKLILRDRINVDLDETFGLEIECENANWGKIGKRMIEDWQLTDDISLENGAEIKSSPLTDSKKNWDDLRNMCKVLMNHAFIGTHTGGHVHVGIQALGHDIKSLINFMKLWAIYEHIIYRFSYGEFTGPRPGIKGAAMESKIDFINACYFYEHEDASKEEILKHLSAEKCVAVNFKHYHTLRTLEFRCPNASLNPVIWQNNVNLFVKMMLYAKSDKFNSSFIEEKFSKIFIIEKTPNEIYVNDALELIDLIFDNNLDKIYFLRQYLKSFEVSKDYEMAKTFC